MIDRSLEELQSLLTTVADSLVERFEADRKAGLKTSAAQLRADSQALRAERQRLAQRLPADHPDLVTLDNAIAEVDLLEQLDQTASKRADARPRPARDAWTVEGRVLGTKGEPADGVTVRFADSDNKFTADLGTVKTDDEGEFFRVYNPTAHRDLFTTRPEVFAEVLDAAGRLRLRSPDSARVTPGAIAFFDLHLRAAGPGEGGSIPRPEPPRPPPARPRRRRPSSNAPGNRDSNT